MTNPTQIVQGGAQNQERQPPEQTGEQQREAGEVMKGPKPSQLGQSKVLSEDGAGEARTPDRRIGQVAHADKNTEKQKHSADNPDTRLSSPEPEGHGGIGGP